MDGQQEVGGTISVFGHGEIESRIFYQPTRLLWPVSKCPFVKARSKLNLTFFQRLQIFSCDKLEVKKMLCSESNSGLRRPDFDLIYELKTIGSFQLSSVLSKMPESGGGESLIVGCFFLLSLGGMRQDELSCS